MITCDIESITYDELLAYMRQQAEDTFTALSDESCLVTFATKLDTHAEFCLCRDDGKLVGMIAFYANGEGADFAYIPHVYVSPEYRSKGLFTCMLKKITDIVKVKGFDEIRLEVGKENKIALQAYCHHGFELIGNAKSNSLYLHKQIR